jgi:phage minor tail protein G
VKIMFLKEDIFKYGSGSVTLFELSGLQRVEYLTFIQARTVSFDKDSAGASEEARGLAFMQMGIDINAWLVSRSLWNSDLSQDIAQLSEYVRQQWSFDALGQAADMVLLLSNMAVPVAESESTEAGSQEADSPEKS